MINTWIVKETDGTYKMFYNMGGKGKPYKCGNVWSSMYANMKVLPVGPNWHMPNIDDEMIVTTTCNLIDKRLCGDGIVYGWVVRDKDGRLKLFVDIDRPDCQPYKLLNVWSSSYNNWLYIPDGDIIKTDARPTFDDEEPVEVGLQIVYNGKWNKPQDTEPQVVRGTQPKQKRQRPSNRQTQTQRQVVVDSSGNMWRQPNDEYYKNAQYTVADNPYAAIGASIESLDRLGKVVADSINKEWESLRW